MIPTVTASIRQTAAPMEYIKSFGGVFLISVTACLATWRGCIRGFSEALAAYALACGAEVGEISGSGLGGGAIYTSCIGGSSSISEKLRPCVAAFLASSIIGSTAIPGAAPSSGVKAAELLSRPPAVPCGDGDCRCAGATVLAAPAAAATAFFATFGLALGLMVLAVAGGDLAGSAVFFAAAAFGAVFLHIFKSFAIS